MADSTPRILSAEDIWAAKDIEERTVEVPQWGGAVKIRSFSLKQALAISDKTSRTDPRTGKVENDQDMMNRLLLTEGLVEPKLESADYDRLLEKSASAVTLIVKAISDLSSMGVAATSDATKSVEAEPNGTVHLLPGARAEDDPAGAA